MRGKRSFYFLAFALVPLFITLNNPERQIALHQASLTVFKPFLQISHTFSKGLRDSYDSFAQFWHVYGEHGRLVHHAEELERKLVQMEEYQKENERLHKLLDFKKEIPGKTIPALVIGWDLAPWRKTILIDKGTAHGIKKKMAVVNSQGLVGRVIETSQTTSRVILLLDAESRVSALLQKSRDLGVVEGDGSPYLRMTHIDRQSSVKMDERVLSSGFGGIYPKGVPIGTIEMVGTEKNGLELFAVIKPFVNFSKLEEVLVMVSQKISMPEKEIEETAVQENKKPVKSKTKNKKEAGSE